MPHIEPFRGILYNSKRVDISKVVAPPYDVISPEMQNELYHADGCNIIRLILGKDEVADSKKNNKYKRAKQFFNNWLKTKILVQDKTPYIYVYSHEYCYENRKKVRLGFIARMKIEDPRTSRVLPHEYTFLRPKQDRLNLIREVKANLCAIFTLFHDEGGKIEKILKSAFNRKPIFDLEYEDVKHKLWRVNNKALIRRIQEFLQGKEIYIADGHHRYEVALMYRDEMRRKKGQGSRVPPSPRLRRTSKGQGYDYVMMYFTPVNEEGLTILSTHRLVRNICMDIKGFIERLRDYFYVKEIGSMKQLFKEMTAAKNACVFGVYSKDKNFYLLKLKKEEILNEIMKEGKSKEWKRLDVSILHGLIFDHILHLREKIQDEDNIIYTRDPQYAIEEIDKAKYNVAFFLNPTKVSQVQDIAKIGDRMPYKSTYFYPKLLSGLVINKL